MIFHRTRMTFKPGVAPQKREEVLESLRNPDMAAKIAALHQRRYDNDAELTQLVSNLGSYGAIRPPAGCSG